MAQPSRQITKFPSRARTISAVTWFPLACLGCPKSTKKNYKVQKSVSGGAPESRRFWDAFRKPFWGAACASSTVNTIWFVTSALFQKVPFWSHFGPLLGALLGAFGGIFPSKSRLKKGLKKVTLKSTQKWLWSPRFTPFPGHRFFDRFLDFWRFVIFGSISKTGGYPPWRILDKNGSKSSILG